MDFKISGEHAQIRDMVREFVTKEVAPVASKIDKENRFPRELVEKVGALGLLGIVVPDEYGGAGLDYLSYALAVEEISRGSGSLGTIVAASNSLVCYPLTHFCTEEQKKKYLVPIAEGKQLGAFALTEPNAGSDAAALETTATLEGEKYILNGNKIFITTGKEANILVVFARIGSLKERHKNINAFIVEKDTPGFSLGVEEEKLGIHGTSTMELIFKDCAIPKENILGKPNDGFTIAMETLDSGRIGIAAQALGIAQSALDAALQYSKQRVQFGKPISEFQAIRWMLADMGTEIEAARLLVYKSAWMKDNGMNTTKESSMAKLYASEVAFRCASKAVQIHGGYGYVKEFPVERHLRDAKITEIYEGTSEIQRLVISRELLSS